MQTRSKMPENRYIVWFAVIYLHTLIVRVLFIAYNNRILLLFRLKHYPTVVEMQIFPM